MNPLQDIDEFWHYRPILWAIVGLFLTFLAWASFAEIDQHVRAFGKIVPSGKARTVQHLEGGIVQEILVEEGQQVERGDTLFLVANTAAKSRLQELELELLSRRLAQLRLRAEIDREENVSFPPELEAEHPDLVRAEATLFLANQQQHREALRALEERLKQKSLTLSALDARVGNLEKEQAITARQAQLKQKLFQSGAASEAQYLEAFSVHRKLVTALEQARNEMPIVRAETIELKSLIEEKEQEYSASLSQRLNEVDLELKTLTQRASTFEDEVARSAIVSPITGTLNKLYIHTRGGVIHAGAPVAEITPANEALVVEGRINIADRGKLWPGLPVMTKITAYDYTIYGGIAGELTYISPDSFVDEQDREHYRVRVQLSNNHIEGHKDMILRPGMTTEVSILTGKKSVLGALLKPVNDISSNALRET